METEPTGDARLTLKSGNRKTGQMPVSTSHSAFCPDTCPFKDGQCYAKSGPTKLVWDQVASVGHEWNRFCERVATEIPDGTVWRHNQAGDLPGINRQINGKMLAKLVRANKGKKGFTYTHKPVLEEESGHAPANRSKVEIANREGFTVNLSGNNLRHADKLASLGIAPVVSVVPQNTPEKFVTPEGRKGRICPAQTKGISCSECKLCSSARRKTIIGFWPHGSAKKKVESIVTGN